MKQYSASRTDVRKVLLLVTCVCQGTMHSSESLKPLAYRHLHHRSLEDYRVSMGVLRLTNDVLGDDRDHSTKLNHQSVLRRNLKSDLNAY